MIEWGAAVAAFFGGGGVIVIAVVWGLKNLDKVERIAGLLFRALNWVHGRWVYRNIATNIQSKVNQYGERLSRQVEGILPRAMKIEWTKDAKSAEASLRDGQVIVTMDASTNRDRNLVVSTVAYLGKGLLPWARLYADTNVMRATDFTIAKDIFVSSGEHSAVQYFFENFLKPEIESNPKLASDCQHIETMQEKGIFTRIFLRQLSVLGNKLYPAVPRESQKKETRDFKQYGSG